jgi:hypothetical protein
MSTLLDNFFTGSSSSGFVFIRQKNDLRAPEQCHSIAEIEVVSEATAAAAAAAFDADPFSGNIVLESMSLSRGCERLDGDICSMT